jgi:sugar/nucleoside kinase (ribokinase family)
MANEEEACALASCENVDESLRRLAEFAGEAVVTLGRQGIVAQRGEERTSVEALSVTVVDTTGSGDAATGTYLACRLRGDDLEPALTAAVRAAAAVVAGLGADGSRSSRP